jgi:predicted anti-sigma-YlaC factor YlaD
MDWKLSSSRERAGALKLTLGDHADCPEMPPGRGNFSSTSTHYYCMDCDTIRVAISTQIDGEVPWLPPDVLETHLAGCADCRDWQRRAHTVTRRVRLGGAFLDHDLTPGVLAAVPVAHDRSRLRLARRYLLVALALAQFAIAAPMLFLGHDHEVGVHAAHELGSFNLALAIAFAVGAVRPKLSAGLAWPCGIAAGGLVTTAIIDLIGGQALGADEAQHLVALVGAALLVWQSRERDAGSAAPAIVPGEEPAVTPAGRDEAAAFPRLEAAPDHPWGGDAARTTAPGVAAQAMSVPSDAAEATTANPVARQADPDPNPDPAAAHDEAVA